MRVWPLGGIQNGYCLRPMAWMMRTLAEAQRGGILVHFEDSDTRVQRYDVRETLWNQVSKDIVWHMKYVWHCHVRYSNRSTVEALVEEGYELLYGGGYSDSSLGSNDSCPSFFLTLKVLKFTFSFEQPSTFYTAILASWQARYGPEADMVRVPRSFRQLPSEWFVCLHG